MRRLSLILAVGALAATTAVSSAQTPLTLQLGPGRDATQAGTATLTAMGNQTRVVLDMTPAGASQPAHVHVGSCPGVGAVAFPLTNVANGKAETTVNASLEQIQARQHSINVHRSPQEAAIYTACVNLPVRSTTTATAGATQLPRTGGPALGLLGLLGVAFGGVGYALRRR